MKPFVWNHIVVGAILVVAGSWAGMTRDTGTARTMTRIAFVAGVWLITASFILGSLETAAGHWNDIVIGVIVLVLTLAYGLLLQSRG